MRNSCSAVTMSAWLLPLALIGAGASAQPVTTEHLIALPDADIYLLGEVHDNAIHHRNQASAISALEPAAVVFEMLTPGRAAIVNQSDARGAALGKALEWDDSGWPAWVLYQPVFEALGSAHVEGMALPRADVRRSVMEGAAAVFGEDAEAFGLSTPLPDAQQQSREALQLAAHCDALPEEMLPGMVEAQRLRDAAFARTILRALEDHGSPVAVVVGTGHVGAEWGLPDVFARVAPDVNVHVIAQVEAAPENPSQYARWIETEAATREDPCKGFAVGHSASDG